MTKYGPPLPATHWGPFWGPRWEEPDVVSPSELEAALQNCTKVYFFCLQCFYLTQCACLWAKFNNSHGLVVLHLVWGMINAYIIVECWITSWPRILYYQHRQTLHAPGGQVGGWEQRSKRSTLPSLVFKFSLMLEFCHSRLALSWIWGQTFWPLANSFICFFLVKLKGVRWVGGQRGRAAHALFASTNFCKLAWISGSPFYCGQIVFSFMITLQCKVYTV